MFNSSTKRQFCKTDVMCSCGLSLHKLIHTYTGLDTHKFEDYIRLHKIITGFSSRDIWEILKSKKDITPFLDRVPDEFDKWVRQEISHFKYGLYSIREYCGKLHDRFRYGKYGDVDPEPTKKEFAEYLMKYVDKKYHSICFAMWSGNNEKVDKLIWKLMKPKYEKPFWNESEG